MRVRIVISIGCLYGFGAPAFFNVRFSVKWLMEALNPKSDKII